MNKSVFVKILANTKWSDLDETRLISITTQIAPDAMYPHFVKTLIKNPVDIQQSLTPDTINLLHMGIGIAGEAGEILELVKKTVINGHPINRDKFINELGDIEFYLEGIRQHLNITRQAVLSANVEKLHDRYHGLYSDQASIERADIKPEA